MQLGSGRYSCALNSWMQALAIQRLLPTLKYVVNCFKLPQDGIIHVVDLGCSCGANALNVANIISTSFRTNGASKIQYLMFNCNNVFWILEMGQKKWRWRLARGYIMLWVSEVHFGNVYFLLQVFILLFHVMHCIGLPM